MHSCTSELRSVKVWLQVQISVGEAVSTDFQPGVKKLFKKFSVKIKVYILTANSCLEAQLWWEDTWERWHKGSQAFCVLVASMKLKKTVSFNRYDIGVTAGSALGSMCAHIKSCLCRSSVIQVMVV